MNAPRRLSRRTQDILLTVVALAFVTWASGRPRGDLALVVVGALLGLLAVGILVARLRSGPEQRR